MDTPRLILYALLALIVYSLWTAWQVDYPPTYLKPTQVQVANSVSEPLISTSSEGQPISELPQEQTKSLNQNTKLITVKTDVLNLVIDTQYGDIIETKLLQYPTSVEDKNKPFVLLDNVPDERYIANSRIFRVEGQKIEDINFQFTSPQTHYELSPSHTQLIVVLEGKNSQGLRVKKEFIFHPGSYLIDVNYVLANEGTTSWEGYFNTQLLRDSPKEDKSSMFHVGSYTGASYSNPGEHHYKKVSFKDMHKENLDVKALGGWIAMQQRYFLTAWIPNKDGQRFYTRASNGEYTIGTVSQPIVLGKDKTAVVGSKLYVGPEIASVLKSIAPGLDLTIDYGWLWFLSSLLFSLLKMIHSFIGNWGWSIVAVTALIKLAFYRLSATSYKSMAMMRKMQPKLQSLRERYGDDKAKMSQATMELYRQEKVNPLGGCLPILVQIPVFIALYWVLLESVELRQAPFMLWIRDLAATDPYHVLPIIMGATMLIQQKLNPAPPDPMQAKMMMFLPVLFTALFWSFPAGLVLYWIVNNTLSIVQQWYITRKYDDSKPSPKLAISKS